MKARLSIVCVVTLVAVADVRAETGPLAEQLRRSRTTPALVLAPPPAARLIQRESQPKAAKQCRRGRRAWIGALVGTGAAIPAAVIAHRHWENEAANGGAAAATMLALGAAGGAFIGLATCDP